MFYRTPHSTLYYIKDKMLQPMMNKIVLGVNFWGSIESANFHTLSIHPGSTPCQSNHLSTQRFSIMLLNDHYIVNGEFFKLLTKNNIKYGSPIHS